MARLAATWLTLAVLGWLPACTATEQFACNADAQCMADGAAGRCEPEGVCSFPDPSCPSGHRYGELAGELSGECVGEASSSSAATDPGMTSSVAEGTTGADGSGSTGPSTTGTSSTSSTSSPATTEPTTSESSTSSTTGPEPGTTGQGPDPYGPCQDDTECEPPGACIPDAGVCAPPCSRDQDCPDALTGNGVSIECRTLAPTGDMGCVITCSASDECPEGMTCVEPLLGLDQCGWA